MKESKKVKPERNPPCWLVWPLPTNTATDPKLIKTIDGLVKKLNLAGINQKLAEVRPLTTYDAAANHAITALWPQMAQLAADAPVLLMQFAVEHMPPTPKLRVLRRLSKHPSSQVRSKVRKHLEETRYREVALPPNRKPEAEWNTAGWFRGVNPRSNLTRARTGRRIQEKLDLPAIGSVAELRELLSIKSPEQLGYFLLATDVDGGPYRKFKIPKRDGTKREICAPKKQLIWVQRMILRKILERVPVHPAAHGFVAGRSTVTGAAAHQGARLLLKFDLQDFFPTIHYNRVIGLFVKLGYHYGDGRFHTHDEAEEIAPVLARLCSYTTDPRQFGVGAVPQGAPTSPAISNLICRGLDGRLSGLAEKMGGVYTRYADDLTFSFKKDELDVGRFRWWVDQICHQEGFVVNESKFRVIRASQRQVVTGIVVNDALRVPREQRRRFRAILHNCKVHGVKSQERDNPMFTSYLRGFASYLHMVHPEEGAPLLREVNALLGEEEDA